MFTYEKFWNLFASHDASEPVKDQLLYKQFIVAEKVSV